MTLDQDVARQAPLAADARPRERRARTAMGIAALVVAALIAVYAVAVRSSLAATSAWLDADPVRCVGAEVAPRAGADGISVQTVSLRDGMRCTIRVQVTNRGWLRVNVNSVTVPLAGDSALDLRAVGATNGTLVTPPFPTVDATFAVEDISIAPGATVTLETVVEYGGQARLSECTASEGATPIVELSALGLIGTRQPDRSIWFLQGDPDSCEQG